MLTCRRCGGLTPQEAVIIQPPRSGSAAQIDCLHCDAPLPRPPRWARRLSVLLGPAGAILLAACYGASGRYRDPAPTPMPDGLTRADRDHDGTLGPYQCRPDMAGDCAERIRSAPAAADVDCDDANASVFPGAPDVDGDGVDGNCDGVDGWADPAKAAAPAETIARPPASP